jgi:hypothetical protein
MVAVARLFRLKGIVFEHVIYPYRFTWSCFLGMLRHYLWGNELSRLWHVEEARSYPVMIERLLRGPGFLGRNGII